MTDRELYPDTCPECGQSAWINPAVSWSIHCSSGKCKYADAEAKTRHQAEALDPNPKEFQGGTLGSAVQKLKGLRGGRRE